MQYDIMRVYEFAKQVDIPVKDILGELKKGGFTVASHMSVLDDDALAYIEKKFTAPKVAGAPKLEQKLPLVHEETEQKYKKIAEDRPKEKSPVRRANERIEQKSKVKPQFKKQYKKIEEPAQPQAIIIQPMSVVDLAQKAARPVNELILTLLKMGIMAAKNQVLTEEVVAQVAKLFELEVIKPEESKQGRQVAQQVAGADLHTRLPIVTVLGHVDHGKTTLLDFIRKTRVAAREKGGITQHLGAYEASTPQGNIVFLDTPGHEAFSKIRQRGVKAADIAVIVVAADDGLMPQTLEAITQAKLMHVPIIVAINKIDRVDEKRLEVIKRQLAQHDLVPEDWGGDIICAPISAKFGQGIDHLLDMIVLQAQMMELRANYAGKARGYVLESKIEKGRGAVATVISQGGTIHVGDYFVAGKTGGKISSLVDSYGKRIEKAEPSVPVQVAGFEELPEAGDYFEVVLKSEFRKALQAAQEKQKVAPTKLITEGAINIIVKTDSDSSKEALVESITKLSKKSEVGFNIIYAGIGNVNESDIELAFNTGASIVCLHVKAEANAAILAQRRAVSIAHFGIIYKLLEDLEQRAENAKEIEIVRTKVGQAEVLKVFNIKNIGVIAGSIIKDGRFTRDGYIVAWRGPEKIGEGKISSLQRDKKTVKEVHTGFECGFIVAGIEDWMPGDIAECFLDLPKK